MLQINIFLFLKILLIIVFWKKLLKKNSWLEDDCVAVTGSLSLQRASARDNHNCRDG